MTCGNILVLYNTSHDIGQHHYCSISPSVYLYEHCVSQNLARKGVPYFSKCTPPKTHVIPRKMRVGRLFSLWHGPFLSDICSFPAGVAWSAQHFYVLSWLITITSTGGFSGNPTWRCLIHPNLRWNYITCNQTDITDTSHIYRLYVHNRIWNQKMLDTKEAAFESIYN